MKKLIITLPKYKFANYVLVNGENVSFAKDKRTKLFTAEYETNAEVVMVSFDTFNPLLKWSWWLLGVLFYIITIFGILDSHESHKFIYRYEARLTLAEGDNVLTLKPERGKGAVVKASATCGYEEISNIKDRDKVVKRRSILLTLTKVLILLAGIILLIIFIILLFVAFLERIKGNV